MLVKIGVCLKQEHVYYFDRLGITIGIFEEFFQSAPRTELLNSMFYPLQKIDVAPNDCASNLALLYAKSFGIQKGNQLFFSVVKPALLYCGDMFFIEDEELSFATLAEWFDLEKALFLLVINGDAGELFRGEFPGYTFTLRYRERNHHIPHIHVDYKHERSGSLRIEDGEMFEGGTLRKSEARLAKRIILERKDLLEEAWDKMQSGLLQNLNLALGNELIHHME